MTGRRIGRYSARDFLRAEWRLLTHWAPSSRSWEIPLYAALAVGVPMLMGVAAGHLAWGLVASLGGLVFLYTPNTLLSHRMVMLMACTCGITACYTFGALAHFVPGLQVVVLLFLTLLVSVVCRYYAVAPPGSLFFVMPAMIGMNTPQPLLQVPTSVGLLFMGGLVACLLAFVYSLHVLRQKPAQPAPPRAPWNFDFVVLDSVFISLFVGLSMALAQALQLERSYWVPTSCLAVIQGASVRAVWNRQLQRIVGTVLGLLLAWGLLALPLNGWSVALLMMALSFIIENCVVRNYGLAAIFITPMTILLAEATALPNVNANAILGARLIDTVLGCAVGLLGAVVLHSERMRQYLRRLISPLFSSRLRN